MGSVKESSIQRSIKEYLKSQGWFVRKWHQGKYAGAGMPDLYATKDSVALHIEVKRPDKKVTPRQRLTLDNLNGYGTIAIVARSKEDVEDFLNSEKFLKYWRWISENPHKDALMELVRGIR